MVRSTLELQRDVLEERNREPSVEAAEIGVTVTGCAVTLAGTVSSPAEKRAAEAAARRIGGVYAVTNDLRVQPLCVGERTDNDIARAALEALEWTVTVPRDRIVMMVREGWITLEGEVERQFQREAAARAVGDLVGVRGVTNRIEVRAPELARPIVKRIEEALSRSAEVDSRRIQVSVDRGPVAPRGTVSSWTEKDAAERAARTAPGVARVENALKI